MIEKQKTITKSISIIGFGFYTKKEIKLTLLPAIEYTGFIFKRIDILNHPIIEANILFIKNNNNGIIKLEKNGIEIYNIENILSALAGMDLDNIIIELNNIEPPIMDGSAKYFSEAIEKVGIIKQDANREYHFINDIISYNDINYKSEITIYPSSNYKIKTTIEFDNFFFQKAYLNNIEDFKSEISLARKFYSYDKLLSFNTINKNIFNSIIIYINTIDYKKNIKKLKLFKNIFIFPDEILDKVKLRFPNEIARHKILDIIGLLSLLGIKLKGEIIAIKPYNNIIIEFIRKIYRYIKNYKRKKIYNIDIYKKEIFSINDIIKILPHKPPFIFLDKVLEIGKNYIIGIKNVTINESFFIGHFPNEPIMPGVIQIESIAQLGGIFVLNNIQKKKELNKYSTYLLKIEKAKFKKKVVPGDILVLRMDLIESIKKGIIKMQGFGFVKNQIVFETEIMAKVIKI